jgi:transcriptional regulator with XRE-family HTH domain
VRPIRLADAVHHLRSQRGMSARALSLKAGLSPSYVGKLEAGEIEPSVRSFARLARVLGMSPQEVFFCVTQEGLPTLGPPQTKILQLDVTDSDRCHTPPVDSSN